LHVQQNSFNLTSGNSEILIIGHLSSPKTGSSAFYQYEASSLKRADLRHMIKKKAYKSVCIDCCGISWLLVSCSIKFFSYEDIRKHRRGPWWSCTSRWWSFLNGILISCTAQV